MNFSYLCELTQQGLPCYALLEHLSLLFKRAKVTDVCACVCVCVHACVRACVRACVCVHICQSVHLLIPLSVCDFDYNPIRCTVLLIIG